MSSSSYFFSSTLTPVRSPEDADALAGSDRVVVEPFHPDFTYPIFGDQEKIFGYRDLEVKVSFAIITAADSSSTSRAGA